MTRCERAISTSQMWRGTNSATPGYLLFRFLEILLSVVIPVVKWDFGEVFYQDINPAIVRVPKGFGVPSSCLMGSGCPLPKQADYQLRYTPVFIFAAISCQPTKQADNVSIKNV